MLIRILFILGSLLLVGPSSATVGLLSFGHAPTGVTTFSALKIGGGGFISGIAPIPTDGTKLIRTDTYGAYIFNPATGLWEQVVTRSSMPSADACIGCGQGTYEVAVAPSNTSHLYMVFNGYVFSSTNRGVTWTRTAFTQDTGAAANGNNRGFGHMMAVDPANENIVYVGVPTGLFKTTNGGTSWASVAGVATPTTVSSDSGRILIVFDPASSVVGGVTQGIYASSYGTGVYHSTNGGSSFSLTTGTPTTHVVMTISTDGVVYVIPNNCPSMTLSIFSGGSWSSSTFGSGGLCGTGVAADPATAARVVVVDSDGNATISTNHGSTWTGKGTHVLSCIDIAWLCWTNGTSASASIFGAGIEFDRSVSNKLYVTWGLGVLIGTPPSTQTQWTLTSITAGIEQLVTNWVVSSTSGTVGTVWDQGVFSLNNPTVYPSTHGTNNNSGGLGMGWSADYAAPSPGTIVALINWTFSGTNTSGKSTDGGSTWAQFSTPVPNMAAGTGSGGCIAASSSTNYLVVGNDGTINQPYYTTDGGSTWNAITISGVATTGNTGWGLGYPFDLQFCAADRMTANKFYLYNIGSAGSTQGLYVSTNSGAAWSRVFTGAITTGATGLLQKIRSVPSNAGHLFYSLGQASASTFMRSTDGGVNWSAVPNVTEVWAFGFGAVCPSGSYPAIYIAGYVSSVWNIWRSCDGQAATPTWTALTSNSGFPNNSFDAIKTIEGDASTYGKLYIGFQGSGFVYGTLNFLLRRDLDPAANDNTPMGLNQVA